MFDKREFDNVVRSAIEGLPDQFQYALENVAIVVEDEPTPAQLSDVHGDHDSELFGLYEGLPLTERGEGYTGLPDRIFIFRKPLLRSFGTRRAIEREIRRTVIHELGHHMGLDDHEMPY